MIEGIGIDILEIEKIREAIRKWGDNFLKRVFTHEEIQYCRKHRFPYIHFAGRFAAKEAVAKAIGAGFWRKGLKWTDFEITKADNGSAEVRLSGRLNRKIKGRKILISISHCREYAAASAVVVRQGRP